MPQPRYRQVSLEDTPYYHCISRCVRRAFLCGKDENTGFDFEHRRQWIVDRIKLLSSVFAVDLCAYAIMSNHYHIVIRINQDQAIAWSDRKVAERWMQVFTGSSLMQRYLSGINLTTLELEQVTELFATWRKRLSDISWFMRCINEPIARVANAEDHCTGRFWEGRFSSQALLDDRAVLACMTYVDLNPIRAAIAKTPEQSEYTSIQERIVDSHDTQLLPFTGQAEDGIPFRRNDYLELVDWAGRAIITNKRGYIPPAMPPILTRLGMTATPVLAYLSKQEKYPSVALGPVSMLRSFAKSVGRKFLKGQALGKHLCPERAG
jgi:REP element-mobilizing transposase RayT